MTNNQKRYAVYLKTVSDLLGGVGLNSDRPQKLRDQICNTQLLVPVIGAFSAGKSTLLNSFLGHECLSVDISPETALATELHYSESERIEAVDSTGKVQRFKLEQFDEVKEQASSFRFVRVCLNNPALKTIEPLVLVDMPGFDSPLDLHNLAIFEYINRGAHYMVLTSVEDGSLTRSMLRQIEGVYDVNKGISFFLSKSNLRSATEVEEIAEKVAEQLEDQFDETHAVLPVGLDGGADLARVVSEIDPDQLVEKRFSDLIMDLYFEEKGALNSRVAALKSSAEENTHAVRELEDSLKELEQKKDELLEDAESRYGDVRVGRIVERVGQELSNSVEELTQVAMRQGGTALNQTVSEMVRNRLLSEVRISMEELGKEIVSDVSCDFDKLNDTLSRYNGDMAPWFERATESTALMLEKGVDALNALRDKAAGKTDGKAGGVYKVVATILGLTTNVVAPIIEIVIIFLPELLGGLFQQMQEQKQRESIRTSILGEVIPSVKSNLRKELPAIFTEQTRILIQSVCEQFESKIEDQRAVIQSAQDELDAKQSNLDQQISAYEDVLSQLTVLTNDLVK